MREQLTTSFVVAIFVLILADAVFAPGGFAPTYLLIWLAAVTLLFVGVAVTANSLILNVSVVVASWCVWVIVNELRLDPDMRHLGNRLMADSEVVYVLLLHVILQTLIWWMTRWVRRTVP